MFYYINPQNLRIFFVPLPNLFIKRYTMKLQIKLSYLIAILCCIAILDSCVGSSSDEGANLNRAAIIAQDIIKSEFNSNCDFDDMDVRGEETDVADRFKVYQKFSVDGQDYVYKIFIQYKGGDWSDKNNWTYGTLTIENVLTGKHKIFFGSMEAEEAAASVAPASITAGGIVLDIAEQQPTAIRLSMERKLTHAEMKAVVMDLKDKYTNIMFCVDPKTQRGDEYAAYTNGTMFDYDTNVIKKFEDF